MKSLRSWSEVQLKRTAQSGQTPAEREFVEAGRLNEESRKKAWLFCHAGQDMTIIYRQMARTINFEATIHRKLYSSLKKGLLKGT